MSNPAAERPVREKKLRVWFIEESEKPQQELGYSFSCVCRLSLFVGSPVFGSRFFKTVCSYFLQFVTTGVCAGALLLCPLE
jgi:hypothetical protein